MSWLSLVVVLLLSCSFVLGEFHEGEVSGHSGFAYLTKFCFDFSDPHAKDQSKPLAQQSHAGTLELTLQQSGARRDDMRVVIYDDQSASWPQVYQKELPCQQRWDKAKRILPVVWEDNGEFHLPRINIHEHTRPRFWYVVLASEDCTPFPSTSYRVSFKNTEVSFWQREFGVNERGLNSLYFVFALVYTCAMGVHGYALYEFWDRDQLHPIVQLFSTALCLQTSFVVLEFLHYGLFSFNGVGFPFMHGLAQLLHVLSQLCFLFLLILLAHGWTISSESIKNRSMVFTIVGGLAAAFLLCFLWNLFGRDPASTLYIYDSGPGVLLIVLHVLAGAWFAHACRQSFEEEPKESKRSFYYMLGVLYTLWFATVPLIVALAIVLHPWEREKVVASIALTMTSLSYLVMEYLLWPSRAGDYFSISVPDVYKHAADDDKL